MASANSLMKEMQKIASDAQVKVQQLANQATEKSFKYNAQEANTARQWQTEMSNTAHQREVNDLIKAGLNPVLATNSGAQSYTTSSASAQANDPSSSFGALAGQLMQGKVGAYQADTSAAATRAAAAASAAATRYAASQAASAQRYAAAMAYQTKKDEYTWKKDYLQSEKNAQKDIIEAQKNADVYVKNHTPASSVGGMLDKLVNNAGLYDSVTPKNMKQTILGMKNFISSDASKYFSNSGAITKNNYKLNSNGKNFINNMLSNLNLSKTATNRDLFIKAIVFRDPFAFQVFRKYAYKTSMNKSIR